MTSEEFDYEETTEDFVIEEDSEIELPYDDEDEEELEVEGGNPSLAELYEVLPKSLHGLVEPVIEKWQQGIDQEFETIAPYRKFADAGIDPDIIGASLELAQQISTNPKAIYDELAERYGWRQAEQMMETAMNVSQVVEEEETSFFGDVDVEESPVSAELAALREEIESLREERYSEISDAIDENYEYEIGTSMEVLAEEYGDFDQEAVLQRAMILSDQYPDAEIPQLIGAAFEQYSAELDRMRAQLGADRRVPRVAGGSGNSGLPAPEPVVYKTKEDRIAAIEAIAKQFIDN
jgi:hypothetical protein